MTNESLLIPDNKDAHHWECVCLEGVKFLLSNRGTTAFHGTVTAVNWCREMI